MRFVDIVKYESIALVVIMESIVIKSRWQLMEVCCYLCICREAAGKDWHVKIQDAILEKCGANHNIVHMAVDKFSNEVQCNKIIY